MLYLKPQYNRFKEVNNCRKQGILNQVVNQVQCSESVLVCEPGNPAGWRLHDAANHTKLGSTTIVGSHTHTYTTLNGKVRVYVCSYIGCLKIPVSKVMLSCLLSHSITHLMLHMHNTHVRMHIHACTHAHTCMCAWNLNEPHFPENAMLSMHAHCRKVSLLPSPYYSIIASVQAALWNAHSKFIMSILIFYSFKHLYTAIIHSVHMQLTAVGRYMYLCSFTCTSGPEIK